MSKVFLNWNTLHKDCKELVKLLQIKEKNFTKIGIITRGGLFSATILSYELNIKNIFTICVSSYSPQNQRVSLQVINQIEIHQEEILILEDMVDSGNTIKTLRPFFPNSTFACLYAKPKGLQEADIFIRKYLESEWLVFPWDIENQKTYEEP